MVQSGSGVLLVSDVASNFDEVSLERHDLEVSEQSTIDEIADGIRACGVNVTHLTEPRDIPAQALKYRDCAVLSVWSGIQSRNRRSIVPAICEGHGIRYIGADAYAAAISADKALSKSICSEFGIKTPSFILLRDVDTLERLEYINYPIVLKPLYEGGSIGITQSNKAEGVEIAKDLAGKLFTQFKQPILCEEFVRGREVSFCIVGADSAQHIQAVEVEMEDEPDYFDTHLFSMEDKRLAHRQAKQRFRNVTNEVEPIMTERIRAIYSVLGKIDYMRIDGKLTGSEFSCIELSTDPGISRTSLFANSYYSIGSNYERMIREILSTQFENVGAERV